MNRKLLVCLCLLISLAGTVAAQNQTLMGKVTDANGTALPGVSVLVRGTSQGATTDADGNYRVSASANARVGFSYIGFLSQEVAVGNQTTLNVTLQEDTRQLEEVVVSGLATTVKRSNLANAVTRLDSKDLTGATSPVTTDGALQGKVAGANIVANSSVPGVGLTSSSGAFRRWANRPRSRCSSSTAFTSTMVSTATAARRPTKQPPVRQPARRTTTPTA